MAWVEEVKGKIEYGDEKDMGKFVFNIAKGGIVPQRPVIEAEVLPPINIADYTNGK